MQIKVLNWNKYNPRSDVKHSTWFRLEHTLFFHPDFLGLNSSEICFFVSLLCHCSLSNNEVITGNIQSFAKFSRIRTKTVIDAMNKLEQLQVIEILSRDVDVRTRIATNETNERTNETIPDEAKAIIVSKEKSSLNSESWNAYANAYDARYGTLPVRNARTNSLILQITQKIGKDTPAVLAFYVSHGNAYYVQRGHSLQVASGDAEKLRMEWFTGRKVTTRDARKIESNQYERNVARKVYEKVIGGKNEQRGIENTSGRIGKGIQTLSETDRGGDPNSVSRIAERLATKLGLNGDKVSDKN